VEEHADTHGEIEEDKGCEEDQEGRHGSNGVPVQIPPPVAVLTESINFLPYW